MERRLSERKSVYVNVYVPMPGQPALRCAASNISDAGVFLRTSPLYLPRNKSLRLVFAVSDQDSNVVSMHHVPARVARCETDGVGMVFCNRRK